MAGLSAAFSNRARRIGRQSLRWKWSIAAIVPASPETHGTALTLRSFGRPGKQAGRTSHLWERTGHSPQGLIGPTRRAYLSRDAAGDVRARCPIVPLMLSRVLPAGFIPPCLPTKASTPPSGGAWLHEIKHDGFRVVARKDGARVKLYSRPGNDLTYRFPLIVDALAALRTRSCILDGEAVACGADGVPSFDRIRYRRHDASVSLYAFDLIELNGDDLRREPLEVRKATLASVLSKAAAGLRLNAHLEHDDGDVVFRHACKMGLEGIVSKRKASPYRSGRSPDWLKLKNPACAAVKREAEEDWGR
jgi:bifunctional non-homologous end joining protein LigD